MAGRLERRTLYSELKKRLLKHIEQERPKLLPCERELIEKYGVSRNTVRRAIQELSAEGILKSVQGLGTLVNPPKEIIEDSTILTLVGKKLSPFSDEVFRALMERLDECRLNSIMVSLDHDNPEVSLPRLKRLLGRVPVDGVIFDLHISYSKQIHELISANGRRCVCLRWRPQLYEENFVADDLEKGTWEVAKHLIDLGHRRIALIGFYDGKDLCRTRGVERAFKEAGLEIDRSLLVSQDGVRRNGYQAADALLSAGKSFTAALCMNDQMALGVMERLAIAGLKVPEDVSVTGYDNIADSAFYPTPLTTCGVDVDEMVNSTIAMLLRKPAEGSAKECVSIEPKFVLRNSTARASDSKQPCEEAAK